MPPRPVPFIRKNSASPGKLHGSSIDRSVFVSDGLKVGHLIISTSEKFGELRFLSCVHYHCDQHHSFVRNKRRMDTE